MLKFNVNLVLWQNFVVAGKKSCQFISTYEIFVALKYIQISLKNFTKHEITICQNLFIRNCQRLRCSPPPPPPPITLLLYIKTGSGGRRLILTDRKKAAAAFPKTYRRVPGHIAPPAPAFSARYLPRFVDPLLLLAPSHTHYQYLVKCTDITSLGNKFNALTGSLPVLSLMLYRIKTLCRAKSSGRIKLISKGHRQDQNNYGTVLKTKTGSPRSLRHKQDHHYIFVTSRIFAKFHTHRITANFNAQTGSLITLTHIQDHY